MLDMTSCIRLIFFKKTKKIGLGIANMFSKRKKLIMNLKSNTSQMIFLKY
jgi:hypothetical protein